jgi:serine protease AprX
MIRRTITATAVLTALLTVLPASTTTTMAAPRGTHHADVDPALGSARGTTSLLVVRTPFSGDAADRAVRRLGGTVTRDLPIVNGFAARLSAKKVADLAATTGVASLTLDRHVTVQGTVATSTLNSVYAKATHADDLNRLGNTGAGVTVALVDTGVADLPDLAGRVVPVQTDLVGTMAPCENLSGESDCRDSYGHGTFLAGLIAGTGAASAGQYKGVAPGAKIVSVKIAGRDGSADVSNLIAAIQWVVSFKDRYGIRVMNLSIGTDSTQSYRVDPLNYAVERAWAAGIVVVVSASNRGPAARTISKPGDDPFVLTVGAVDDRGTSGLGDDALPNFSSHGPTAADGLAKPDVVAPGAHLVSLNAPGSAIATNFPSSMAAPYRRGSGTSMSTAVVSGEVALLLAQNPCLTPDRVKYELMATAHKVAADDPYAVGAGMVDVSAAVTAPAGLANQGVPRSSGTGSLDLSRGTVRVQADDPMQTVISGETTAQLLLWNPVAYTGTEWTGVNWYGSDFYGVNWYGVNWYGSDWAGVNWYGSSFYGQADGVNWYGVNWYGSAWYGVWE